MSPEDVKLQMSIDGCLKYLFGKTIVGKKKKTIGHFYVCMHHGPV
jgi:hypothetical protein